MPPLSDFEQHAGQSTPGRDGASLVQYDQRLYLFGGRDNTGASCNQMFMLDTRKPSAFWVQVQQTGDVPTPRFAHNAQLWVRGIHVVMTAIVATMGWRPCTAQPSLRYTL